MKFNTALLHGDFRGDKATGATLTPVYQSSAFERNIKAVCKFCKFLYIGNIKSRIAYCLCKIKSCMFIGCSPEFLKIVIFNISCLNSEAFQIPE